MHPEYIENDFLKLQISRTGAEIRSLISKKDNREWMWQAIPEFWPRVAPILFPIVGKLADDQYNYRGQAYTLSQHGFARDRTFEVLKSRPDHIRFLLQSDADSEKFYPFDFDLIIGYFLEENRIRIEYKVVNTGNGAMFFSIGGHPGFALPGWPEKKYYLRFEQEEPLIPRLLRSGLLEKTTGPGLQTTKGEIEIDADLFAKDALIFEGLKSEWVELRSESNYQKLRFHFKGFPWFALWSKPGAAFVCLEPWFGHADLPDHSRELEKKTGIMKLNPGERFICSYGIEIFT
jgi:galactose mutarotase-like enzyme